MRALAVGLAGWACREPWLSITDPQQRKAFLKQLHELKTDVRHSCTALLCVRQPGAHPLPRCTRSLCWLHIVDTRKLCGGCMRGFCRSGAVAGQMVGAWREGCIMIAWHMG